ncbi:hypothetical protein [Aeromonas media]|uniref:hypothetical protein n=1 Tax=Aeromonas media TaxID=651 RepID=UPI001118F218|nr:hypothetical protein [Aeromonas media]
MFESEHSSSTYVTFEGNNYECFFGGSWIEVHQTNDSIEEWAALEHESDSIHIGNYHCDTLEFTNKDWYVIDTDSVTAKLIEKLILTKPLAIMDNGIMVAYNPQNNKAAVYSVSNMVPRQEVFLSFDENGKAHNVAVFCEFDDESFFTPTGYQYEIGRAKILRDYYHDKI